MTEFPNSSHIAGADYDEAKRTLTLTFRKGGNYTYHDVGKTCYQGLCEAPSAGRYFRQHIKGVYEWSR